MIKNFDFKSKEIMKDLHKNENDVDQKLTQSPIPNPQSPIPNPHSLFIK